MAKPLCPLSKGKSLGYNPVQLQVNCYYDSGGIEILNVAGFLAPPVSRTRKPSQSMVNYIHLPEAAVIYSKFTEEHSCQSVISIKFLCNFIEIAL